MLGKGPTIPADMTFLDLEDAVAPLEKEAARPKVVDAIKNLPWDDRVLCVRVNGGTPSGPRSTSSRWSATRASDSTRSCCRRCRRAAEVVAMDLLLTQVERRLACR